MIEFCDNNQSEVSDVADFRIKVTDQGIGISAEDRPNLFSPYFKTQDAESRRLNR